jgi:glycosyltransferase involved in cell wall biosynthesis
MSAARLALLPDFLEENWPSMDLVAEQLLLGMQTYHAGQFTTIRSCPHYLRPATRLMGQRGGAVNLDRLFNRFVNYPRYIKKIAHNFELFHVCDHSYSQIVHALPANRTGVFCHDLDTFRCILDPAAEPRPKWFRAMADRILRGLQKATLVFHTTDEIRRQILHYSLIDPARLVQAPYGIAAEFNETGSNLDSLSPVQGSLLDGGPFLLHVGSCIPRKRIDVLLDVFASVRRAIPALKLVQIGGEWTPAQLKQIDALAIRDRLLPLGRQPRSVVASFYRRAAAVLMPSESEGFGLPVAEAMACGAIVIASQIPVLCEVGAEAAVYAPLGDISAWTATVLQVLQSPATAPPKAARLARAAQFSWKRHADIISAAYSRLPGITEVASC